MQKISLQSNNRKGTKVTMLHAETVEFNEAGVAEVEVTEEQLAEMLDFYPDLSVVSGEGSDLKPQTEGNDLGKSEDEKNDLGGEKEPEVLGGAGTGIVEPPAAEGSASGNQSTTDPVSLIAAMNLPDLKAMAAESGFPEEEWKGLTKPALKEYLVNKLK